MDISLSVPWLLEVGMEEPRLTHQIEMDALDKFLTQNLDALGEDFQHPFSSESNSSSPALIPKGDSTTNFSYMETSRTNMKRPLKQQKLNNVSTTQNVLNPETSPLILPFSNLNSSTDSQKSHESSLGTVNGKDNNALSSEDLSFLSNVLVSQDSSYVNQDNAIKAEKEIYAEIPSSKPPSQSEYHVLAERKRREKLTRRFIDLSAIVPGLRKMDKASILGEAIKHMKQLQERVKTLEEQAANKAVESVVIVKKSQLLLQDDSYSFNEAPDGPSNEQLPEIEARVSGKNVFLRIQCEKQKGVLVKTLAETEKLNLTVLNTSVMPFGNLSLDITIIAEMEDEFCLTAKELVRSLLSAFTKVEASGSSTPCV